MKRHFGVLGALLLAGTTLADETLLPMAELNVMKPGGISLREGLLVFEAAGGSKTFDPSTGMWTYKVAEEERDRRTILADYSFNHGAMDAQPPGWYPQPTYLIGTQVDDPGDPSWMLIKTAGEGAVFDSEDLIDIKKRIIYQLPNATYFTFLIHDGSAWLGSTSGVSRVNFKTLDWTDYVTFPATDLSGVWDDGNQVYVASHERGLFSVDRLTGAVRTIESINKRVRAGYRIMSMIYRDRYLYLLLGGETVLLATHHLDRSVSRVFETGLPYADRLRFIGNKLYGYGRWETAMEGGDYFESGSAFEFSPAQMKVATISNAPVNYMDDRGRTAVAILTDYSPVQIQHEDAPYETILVKLLKRPKEGGLLEDDGEPMRLVSVNDTYMKVVPNDGRAPSARKISVKDPESKAAKLLLEMDEFEKQRRAEYLRNYELLYSLQVRFATIPVSRGKVAVTNSDRPK